ncbi:MAG: hypothetical protein IPH07_32505 [Deltaproteobacteria bacterium]|nr:hypothetical protein [Deltaproteobacteria bacterium]MBK8234906.1 hypothetical protein [Deltaproteobacteria bacterium]MBK8719775.1 hypothetical protein [Deltaproteobacteria bacterium]MBP7285249.1 hypothetical protein [Nannocystaceae bacterium]
MRTALLVTALTCSAAMAVQVRAATRQSVSGWARRGDYTLAGSLVREGTKTTGEFVLLIYPTTPGGASCRFTSFHDVRFDVGSVRFEGRGTCTSMPATGAPLTTDVDCRFVLEDGVKDRFDVEKVGTTGVSVPGGTIDSGDLKIR